MTLIKPNQQRRREFQDLAIDVKWSAVDLMQIAVRLSQTGEDRLKGYHLKPGRMQE